MNQQIYKQLDKVNAEVDRLLSTSPLIVRKYTQHLSKAKGKGIRALSVLISAMDENQSIHEDAFTFASGIEILHLATLVHDDVMDEADSRRGIPTLHTLYGKKTAVITGDYLMALAMSLMNKVEDKDKYLNFDFSDIMLEIALGELSQHINNGNLNLSIPEYLKIINGKTAKLFEASFYAGVITRSADIEEINAYKKIGELIGMMFQINDDMIDFLQDETQALKPVQSDYEQGVMTLPLLYAFEQDPSLKEGKLNRSIINKIVKQFDGVGYSKNKTREYYDEAVAILNGLELDPIKYDLLKGLLDKAHSTI